MKIRIQKMKLQNFKGIREFEIDFNSLDTEIYGKNATGKTSIVDAFTWLFFDKDSNGSAKFDVKTKTPDGEFLHNLEHSVEVSLMIDGTETTFKKILKEKYTKQRGASTAVFAGHTTDYFVDDVPRKKKEFDEIVNSTFDASIFPIITDPFYFNEKMKWQDRRKMLIDICGDVSDAQVIGIHEELKELESYLETKSIDDLRAQLKSQMKPINDELKMIPVRINEAQLSIPTDIKEFEPLAQKRQDISKEIDDLQNKKRLASTNASNEEKEVEIARLRGRRVLINDERPDIKKEENEIYRLEYEARRLKVDIESDNFEIKTTIHKMNQNEEKRNELRKEWKEVNSSVYDESQNICPACGQELPFDKIEGFKERFNLNKAKHLEAINAEGKRLKAEYDDMDEKIAKLETEMHEGQKEYDGMIEKIKSLRASIDKKTKELNEKKIPKIKKVDEEIERIQKEIDSNDSSKEIELISEKISQKQFELNEIEQEFAKRRLAENQLKRIKELEDQEKHLVVEYSEKERLLFLTDEFIKAKVEILTEKINSNFDMVKFKLFDEQINGGVVECCECTYKGVTYSNLNNAAKINCGLDIINTICKSRDTYAPIFIDNAESVNHVIHTDSQQIRLYVTTHQALTANNNFEN